MTAPVLIPGQAVRVTRADGRTEVGHVVSVRQDAREVTFAIVTGHELLWNNRCWRRVPSGERVELEIA